MPKTYCRPLKRGTSWRSQNFGDNKTIYGPHTGNDEACNSGTPVYAAGDGVIEWAGEFDDSYADNLLWLLRMGGNVAVLNCGDDEPSFVYAHLKSFYVRPGEQVKKGQLIALSGNSGTATTGPHLHVECIPPGYVLNSPLLGRVNPDLYLTEWPEDIVSVQPQSTGENKLSASEVKEIIDFVQAAHDVTRGHIIKQTVKQVNDYTEAASQVTRGLLTDEIRAMDTAAEIVQAIPEVLIESVAKGLAERLSK